MGTGDYLFASEWKTIACHTGVVSTDNNLPNVSLRLLISGSKYSIYLFISSLATQKHNSMLIIDYFVWWNQYIVLVVY